MRGAGRLPSAPSTPRAHHPWSATHTHSCTCPRCHYPYVASGVPPRSTAASVADGDVPPSLRRRCCGSRHALPQRPMPIGRGRRAAPPRTLVACYAGIAGMYALEPPPAGDPAHGRAGSSPSYDGRSAVHRAPEREPKVDRLAEVEKACQQPLIPRSPAHERSQVASTTSVQ